MKSLLSIAALLTLAAPQTSEDPLARLPTAPIDIELKDAPADEVYALLSDITETTFEIEPCEAPTLTLALRGVPVPVLMRLMASRLGRSYAWRGDHLAVVCEQQPAPEPELDFVLSDVPAATALEVVADVTGQPIEVHGCADHRVDLEAKRVPAATAFDAMVVQLGARRWDEDGVAHVAC